MSLSQNQITTFQEKILTWYEFHKRDLPWREVPFDTSLGQRDPYKILVSEIMLQQTQVVRVIPKYEAWLIVFPTVESLAEASVADVLRLWSGLGYNRRALYLKKCAEALVASSLSSSRKSKLLDRVRGTDSRLHENDNIVWPRTIAELKRLPGIGEYTAAAVACFAFDEQVGVIDTNIRKIVLTQFPEETEGKRGTEETVIIRQIANQLLPKGQALRLSSGRLIKATAYDWNQALMDYSAVMLKKEKISIPKQSKFKGSNRYYRGLLLKTLTTKQQLVIGEVKTLFGDVTDAFVQSIITGLAKDGLIKKTNNTVQLP